MRSSRLTGRSLGGAAATAILAFVIAATSSASAQVFGQQIDEPEIPEGVDVFSLSLDEFRELSAMEDFEVIGHSYFKIDDRTPWAKGDDREGPEVGSGFNTPRVYDGIAYLGGYGFPPTLFGILIADVSDPENMEPLSFIPCNPGTRCPYLRVNNEKKVLVFGHDRTGNNPNAVPEGGQTESGVSFYDVSDPSDPQELAFVPSVPNGKGHGLDIDDRYAYVCATFESDMEREGIVIIDYDDPADPQVVSTFHVPGQREGEEREPLNRNNPDGTPQILQCHEIVYHNDRLYVAYRDVGMLILDIEDRADPKILANYDYVPPYHGGRLGAAHTSAPVVVDEEEHPDLVIHTDEIFDCPPGFGRILDVSDLKNSEVVAGDRPANIQLLSTFRLPHISEEFDHEAGEFVCGDSQHSIHLPWFDHRSPSLVYITWYDEGVRVLDISNPSAPEFRGYFLSPRFGIPDDPGRQIREVWQDPETDLLYVTDGNGGGLIVLRYTGPIPEHRPIAGVR